MGIPPGFRIVGRESETIPEGFGIVTPERKINKLLEFSNKIAQGATLGFGDEISAAMAGGMASLMGGDFRDAYDYSLGQIRGNMDEYERQNPKMALAAELVGGVGTGAVAGARLMGGQALQGVSNANKYGRIAAIGGAEGGLYGAGSSDENRISGALTGALIGSVLAPVGTKAVDWLVQGGKSSLSFLGRKLMATPRSEAIRAIRNAAINEGIDLDDAIKMMDDLGPEGTLADLGENFRKLAKAAANQAGPMKSEARNLVNYRQMGQQQRLLDAAEVAAGARAGDFNSARQALIQSRADASKPLYEAAFEIGIDPSDELTRVMNRPAVASALNKADRLAANEGQWTGTLNLMQRLHYAKMDIDDQIGSAITSGKRSLARTLMQAKNDLLGVMDKNSSYQKARNLYSGDSQMINAMDKGLDFFRTSIDEMDESLNGMSAGEKELYRLGAVRAIRDKLDDTNMTHDATRRLLGTKSSRERLARIMDEPESFIRRALAESEFSRTRQVITGGSDTAENLAMQSSLGDSIQPEFIYGLIRQDAAAAGAGLARMLTKKQVTPETIKEISGLMLKQGISPSQMMEIFTQPAIQNSVGRDAYRGVVLPAIAGSLVPISGAVRD